MTKQRLAVAIVLVALLGLCAWIGQTSTDREADLAHNHTLTSISSDAAASQPVALTNPPLIAAAVESLPQRDWVLSSRESTDYFGLIQELADAALRGDTRANYVLGEVLLRCEIYKRTLATFEEGTLSERVERYLAEQLGGPAHGQVRRRREVFACERVFTENPFDRFDVPLDAHSFRFWSLRAVELGDPIAVMDKALRSAAARSSSVGEEHDRAFRQELIADVRLAVDSGEPSALFMVGTLFSQPAITESVEMGLAWQLAACESGYDCTNANPDFGFGCIEVGTCVAGLTFADVLQRDLGPVKYASVYASAQDILYKTRLGDWDGLQQYLKIK